MKFIFLFFIIISCTTSDPEETSSSESSFIKPGDVVVTSIVSDSAILLDSDGNFKSLIYNPANNLEQVSGVSWNAQTNEVILAINGSPDRVMAISAVTGDAREAVVHSQLNGNVYGVTSNSDGDYLVVESNNLEKFTANGSRINDGNFPVVSIQTNPAQINTLSNDGFLLCSYGSDVVRTYDSNATQINSTSSGIGGTTNGYGCNVLPNGNIVTSWDGTSDSVVIFDSTLSTALYTFNDSSYMTAPRGVGVKRNGNILVGDAGFDWIIELDSTGNFVSIFSMGLFNDPWQILVIPNF